MKLNRKSWKYIKSRPQCLRTTWWKMFCERLNEFLNFSQENFYLQIQSTTKTPPSDLAESPLGRTQETGGTSLWDSLPSRANPEHLKIRSCATLCNQIGSHLQTFLTLWQSTPKWHFWTPGRTGWVWFHWLAKWTRHFWPSTEQCFQRCYSSSRKILHPGRGNSA